MRREPARGGPRRVLFVTYTLGHPRVVGVFFRALRLAFEMRRRGWRPTVYNCGPIPEDPKVDRASAAGVAVVRLDFGDRPFGSNDVLGVLRGFEPDLVVFGECPIPAIEPLYEAALQLASPLAVLDQYYDDGVGTRRFGVDRMVLYGLRALWRDRVAERGWDLVPPFIERVLPPDELPVPPAPPGVPTVTVLGFEPAVLDEGIELVAGLEGPRPRLVAISHDPEAAARRMAAAGLPQGLAVSLPLQPDEALFGLVAAGRAAVLANGFMQMLEAIALGCPAVCVDRGVGMWPWTLHRRYRSYIALGGDVAERRERLAGWLAASPFPPELLAELADERGGAAATADRLETVARRPALRPRAERAVARLRGAAGRALGTGRRERVPEWEPASEEAEGAR